MKNLIYILIALFLVQCTPTPKSVFNYEIPFEKSKETETATYEQTVEYCKKLAEASPWVKYEVFGQTSQGRDLPMLIVDKNTNFAADKVRKTDNAVLMIQANIHPGEPDGNDAGMMLLRDMVITKTKEALLDHLTIIFIPALNADGLARFNPHNRINQNGPKNMGWRTNATNLNLNRDFLKADAPEMQAWLKVYNQWLPDFFVDCHATDGADYQYVVTYAIDLTSNATEELTNWEKDIYLKELEKKMLAANYPLFPYITFRQWHDPRSGLVAGFSTPMLSTGYCAAQNRPGLLIETHMLKPFKQRVWATYEMLKLTAEILNRDHKTLKDIVLKADTYTASSEFRTKNYAVNYKANNDSTMVDFLGFEYDIVKSKLTGGNWFQYHNDQPKTFQIPFFNNLVATMEVKLPEAYIIPPEWQEIIKRIGLHGIIYTTLKEAKEIEVSSYKFKNVNFGGGSLYDPSGPREGRFTTSYDMDTIKEKRIYPAGSIVIDMNQRASKVIANLLNPKAPSSFIFWGFFNSIFEQKEYAESYVMEKLAREMLAKDPKLQVEFDKLKKDHPEFASNQQAICNWFYSKSPWWNYKKDVYPIGEIFDRKVVDGLKR
ncbi:MAG: hypothetical protein AUJ97_07080 [Bacteroidetes bacterium CG2_30_32_10]|nr:MAG: hypothetical protein AUJ97_07080 [Bacteroidetes bacterium CG2_30_32_10]